MKKWIRKFLGIDELHKHLGEVDSNLSELGERALWRIDQLEKQCTCENYDKAQKDLSFAVENFEKLNEMMKEFKGLVAIVRGEANKKAKPAVKTRAKKTNKTN